MTLLPIMESPISAGFPSPAQDYVEKTLDICDFLIDHPHSTFILRVKGDSMEGARIYDGDFLVVDKAINPFPGKIVIAEIEGEFTCKELQKDAKGNMYLKAHNPNYRDMHLSSEESLVIWGVVIGKFNKV